MSHTAASEKIENLDFKWGKKRGVGGKKKEVQFYESFTYDGLEYSLHDCVYLYKEGEPEPYIGKLIKIWEHPDKAKKVKVHWFFHPIEIRNFLGDEEVLENEIFLASGEGVGVANVNPLEAVAGKCNVVCIAKDRRNPQPTEQELEVADYVFHRTFDVANYRISNEMGDKVSGLEVKFIFNRNECEKSSAVCTIDSEIKEDTPAGANDSLVKAKSLAKDKPASSAVMDSNQLAITAVDGKNIPIDEATGHGIDTKDKFESSKVAADKKVKFDEFGAIDVRPSKKVRVDGSVKSSEERKTNRHQEFVAGTKAKTLMTVIGSSERKVKVVSGKKSAELEKVTPSPKNADSVEDRLYKKPKVDAYAKSAVDKKNSGGNYIKSAATLTSAEEKTKSNVGSAGPEKGPWKQLEEKMGKLSGESFVKKEKSECNGFEVTPKPDDERSKWFRPLPWEERMKSAYEQGMLVLLSNLDLEYTSREVEDIVWHAFKEKCSAKMVQRTAISNPHSGQAFVILRTRGAAEKIVKQLDDGCLILSNGRLLVGNMAPSPSLPGKQSTFVGHLFVDKVKVQTQRERKEAVSTSHCSQPNTIEYDMAMEWCLLQSRSDNWWKRLYKKQEQELSKLKADLKLK